MKEFGGLDDDFMDTTKTFIDFICAAKSNFSSISIEVKQTLFEFFFESAEVSQGELLLKHTPYLEKLLEIRGNSMFEPQEPQSPSSDSGSGNPNLETGEEEGSLFELLLQLQHLYRKYKVKEKIQTISFWKKEKTT